jgi:hypothetical protein
MASSSQIRSNSSQFDFKYPSRYPGLVNRELDGQDPVCFGEGDSHTVHRDSEIGDSGTL